MPPERLEERSLSALFAYQLQDRFRITAILGAHLLALGIGAALLFAKAVYLGGLYDTWACGGGDMRLIERLECALNPYLLAQYLIRPPFGRSLLGLILSNHWRLLAYSNKSSYNDNKSFYMVSRSLPLLHFISSNFMWFYH